MIARGLTLGLAVTACIFAQIVVYAAPTSAPIPGKNPFAPQPPPPAPAAKAVIVPEMPAEPTQAQRLAAVIEAIAAEGWETGELTVAAAPTAITNADSQQAQVLQEFHCTSTISRWFQRGQRRCYVTAYVFNSPTGAYGAYTALRKGATTVLTRGDGSSEDDQGISFWQGDCFVNLRTTAEDDDEAKDLLRNIADRIAPVIQTHARLPAIIAGLPQLDRISGSEKVIMGPVVARQSFPAPYLSLLSLEKSLAAASADYQFSQPTRERLKLLVVDYGNKPLAQSIYNQYVLNLESAHDGETSDRQSLFKMSGTYLLCQVRGDRMAIITGARKKLSPLWLARQISYPD